MKESTIKINNEIRANNVRVIDPEGEQLGIMPLNNAMQIALSHNLDLVEINGGEIPVCKIIDWGKELYRKKKQKHVQHLHNKRQELKELYMRPVTSKHDIEIKVTKALKFLEQGHKVKIGIKFQGRELAHKEVGIALMNNIVTQFEKHVVDQMPFKNNVIQIIVSPGVKK